MVEESKFCKLEVVVPPGCVFLCVGGCCCCPGASLRWWLALFSLSLVLVSVRSLLLSVLLLSLSLSLLSLSLSSLFLLSLPLNRL